MFGGVLVLRVHPDLIRRAIQTGLAWGACILIAAIGVAVLIHEGWRADVFGFAEVCSAHGINVIPEVVEEVPEVWRTWLGGGDQGIFMLKLLRALSIEGVPGVISAQDTGTTVDFAGSIVRRNTNGGHHCQSS